MWGVDPHSVLGVAPEALTTQAPANPPHADHITDRRLLWLPGQAIKPRVHGLRYGALAGVQVQLRRPRRRVATLRVRALHGRVLSFGELRPPVAEAIAGHVRASTPAVTRADEGARRAG